MFQAALRNSGTHIRKQHRQLESVFLDDGAVEESPSYKNLEGSVFIGSVLAGSVFGGSDLERSVLGGSVLERSDLEGSHLGRFCFGDRETRLVLLMLFLFGV